MSYELRSARAADASAVCALQIESWRDAYVGMLDPDFLDGPIEAALEAHWAEALRGRKRAGLVILAMTGWQMHGFVAGRVVGANATIDSLHVRPVKRDEGIGRALLGLGAQRLRQQGATSADLWVFAANEGAIRFYTRLGGQLGAARQADVHGQEVAERQVTWPKIDSLIRACARS